MFTNSHELRPTSNKSFGGFSNVPCRVPGRGSTPTMNLVARLQQHADSFGAAPEQHSEFDVRQALFKTRRGRVYRALFLLEGSDVYLLRVRGPGQASLQPDELA